MNRRNTVFCEETPKTNDERVRDWYEGMAPVFAARWSMRIRGMGIARPNPRLGTERPALVRKADPLLTA